MDIRLYVLQEESASSCHHGRLECHLQTQSCKGSQLNFARVIHIQILLTSCHDTVVTVFSQFVGLTQLQHCPVLCKVKGGGGGGGGGSDIVQMFESEN